MPSLLPRSRKKMGDMGSSAAKASTDASVSNTNIFLIIHISYFSMNSLWKSASDIPILEIRDANSILYLHTAK